MRHLCRPFLLLALVLALAAPARADDDGQSPWRVSGSVGLSSSSGGTYFHVGLGLGYRLWFGLEPGVDGGFWTGVTPNILRVSPRLTWFVPLPFIQPYVGAFYAHWFLFQGFPSADSVGARAGVVLGSMGRASLQAGVIYEKTLDCNGDGCTTISPELSLGIAF